MPKADSQSTRNRIPRTKLNSHAKAQNAIWECESTPPFAIGETAVTLRDNLMFYIGQKYKSFEDFAHAVRIPKSTLSQVLNFRHDPRLSTLEQLARALGVTVAQLLTQQDRD